MQKERMRGLYCRFFSHLLPEFDAFNLWLGGDEEKERVIILTQHLTYTSVLHALSSVLHTYSHVVNLVDEIDLDQDFRNPFRGGSYCLAVGSFLGEGCVGQVDNMTLMEVMLYLLDIHISKGSCLTSFGSRIECKGTVLKSTGTHPVITLSDRFMTDIEICVG
ncbi:MAG: hypothetical protein R3B38_01915 [Patescibacteria group bacterium]